MQVLDVGCTIRALWETLFHGEGRSLLRSSCLKKDSTVKVTLV